MAMKVPDAPETKTINYKDLLGCDFSQDASLVDRAHSPDMVNMISDEGGNPVKRKGLEVLYDFGDDALTNIYSMPIAEWDNRVILEVISNEVVTYYSYENGAVTPITKDGITANDISNTCFYAKNTVQEGLFMFKDSGIEFITYDDGELKHTKPVIYTPTIAISRRPSTDAGTAYEDINLINKQLTESYLTKLGADYDESAETDYMLSVPADTTVTPKYEYRDTDGLWVTGTAEFIDNKHVRVNPAAGEPPVTGEDNAKITYDRASSLKTELLQCKNNAFFIKGSTEQIFVTNNTLAPERVWYSSLGDPTYFPELNYLDLGADGGRCVGFLHVNGELAVIKNEYNDTGNVYLVYDTTITSTTVSTNATTTKTTQEFSYAVKKMSSGVGAVTSRGFATLGDEPLFLSKDGLYGIVMAYGTAERTIRNRSRFVDRVMLTHDLSYARMITHQNYLYVFVDNVAFVFDGRHKTAESRGNTNYLYEAYYWEFSDFVIDCVRVIDDEMYLISGSQLLAFKNTGRMDDYSDGSHWDSEQQRQVEGVPIVARWTTCNDDDNAPQMFKTMLKKGSMVTLAPYEFSSVNVWARTDGKVYSNLIVDENGDPVLDDQGNRQYEEAPGYFIGRFYADSWSGFENIDFNRFTFDTREGPRDYYFKKKRKKYVRMQLIFENAEIDEGFGIHEVVKTYTATRYAKQRS